MVLARPSEYFEDPGEENWSKTAEFSQNYAKMQKMQKRKYAKIAKTERKNWPGAFVAWRTCRQ